MRSWIGRALCSAGLAVISWDSSARAEGASCEGEQTRAAWSCTLGSECERWGDWIAESDLPFSPCAEASAAPAPWVWHTDFDTVPCPFGGCTLYDPQLVRDADGSLVALSAVELPSQHGVGREGGLWFARYSRQGALQSSALRDFSVPPPGLTIERHASLVRDARGKLMLVSSRSVQPFDAPRPLTVRSLSLRELAPHALQLSTPPGWGTAAVPDASGGWLVASLERPQGALRSGVSRFSASGRLGWTRTFPEGSRVEAVRAARSGGALVLASNEREQSYALYALDAQGKALWRRALEGASEAPQFEVTQDGSIIVVTPVQTDFFGEVHISRLSPDGHALEAWLVPNLFIVLPTLRLDERGQAILALPNFSFLFDTLVQWYDLRSGACEGTSYAWPATTTQVQARLGIYADASGARFVAAPTLIAQLREGVQP